MTVRIALDAMSGDYGVSVVVPAALHVLKEYKHLHLILVGDAAILKHALGYQPTHIHQRLSIHHTTQVVAMDESPKNALRNKKDSSMRVAINLVKERYADACVSAGNTGALMATARYVLKTLPGIDRPAIITAMPTMREHPIHMLDLGANVDCTAEHLFQFAVMGSILTSAVENISNPTVGLLNIGQEEIKGNEQIKRTAKLLADSPIINYAGFVEGDDIFKGTVDVVVCDGFLGNVALKSSEGTAKLISFYLKKSLRQNWLSRILGLLTLPILKNFSHKIDHRRYNGASLLGLRGIVIKSHGGTDVVGFSYAIREAITEVEKNVPERISQQLEQLLTV